MILDVAPAKPSTTNDTCCLPPNIAKLRHAEKAHAVKKEKQSHDGSKFVHLGDTSAQEQGCGARCRDHAARAWGIVDSGGAKSKGGIYAGRCLGASLSARRIAPENQDRLKARNARDAVPSDRTALLWEIDVEDT